MKKILLIASILALAGISCPRKPAPTLPGAPAPREPQEVNLPINAPPKTSAAEEPTKEQLYNRAKVFAGSWRGQWRNTTFGSSGAAKADVQVQPDGNASFTIDLDGLVFGVINPKPKTFTGRYDKNGITFTASKDDLFGDITIKVDNQGNIRVEAVQIPITRIKALTALGKITSEKVDMTYQVDFPKDEFAKGVFILNKR